MIIRCGRCRTSFRVDDSRIKITETRVRCSRCGNEFIAKREDEPEEETPESPPETKEHVGQEGEGISEEKFPETESRLEDTRTPDKNDLSLSSPPPEEREIEEEFGEEHLEGKTSGMPEEEELKWGY